MVCLLAFEEAGAIRPGFPFPGDTPDGTNPTDRS